jgi:hypothetical protein
MGTSTNLSVVDWIASTIPDDFKQRLLDLSSTLKLSATAQQSGAVARTILALLSEIFAQGYGISTTVGGTFSAIGSDGILATFAQGGLVKFASSVTPDPSVALSDGSYPIPGNGFLDAVADGIFNVQRVGGPNGGATVESNSSVLGRCIAKLKRQGIDIAESGLDPFVYLVTLAYEGDTLVASITRAKALIGVGTGVVFLYLANGTGIPTNPDVQKVHDWLQAGLVSFGTTLVVQAAAGVNIAITLDAYVPAANEATAIADITAVITEYVDSIPIGGALGLPLGGLGVPLAALEAAIFEGVGYVIDVEGLTIDGVASDRTLAITECAIVSPSPTITVHTV